MTDRYFRLSPGFWDDDALRENVSEDARYLALYLLTCPQRTTEGLFKLNLRYAIGDLQWDDERFRLAFDELVSLDFIDWDQPSRTLLIVNALKYQAPSNRNQAKFAARQVEQLPESRLTRRFKRLANGSKFLWEALPDNFGMGWETEESTGSERIPDPLCSLTPPPPPALTPTPSLGDGSKSTPKTSAREASDDPLVERVNSVCQHPDVEEATLVVDALRGYVEPRLIDECAGYCSTFDDDHKPRFPRYFLTAIYEWAKQRGAVVPLLDINDLRTETPA